MVVCGFGVCIFILVKVFCGGVYVVVSFCECEISLFYFFMEIVLIFLVFFNFSVILDFNDIVVSFYLDELVFEKLLLFFCMFRRIIFCLEVVVFLRK